MNLTKEDKELIQRAKDIIKKSKPAKLIDTSEVGSSLITLNGNIYSGVNLGFYCGIGSCAEYQAIGAMISNGEKDIKIIVAINDEGEVMPPCGKCREMMLQTSKNNKNTEVIVSKSQKVRLKDLMPFAWGGTIEKK
ncbi:MAG: cytidine deaminase [Parcubacteria group bacterium]|jgi:cytidine deaminase